MNITQRDRDLGIGYAMKPSTTRTELTSVGCGTPMGELLRRYWHPAGLVADATDIPRKLRVLGENLVLFRDRHGRAGLLHARCCHRGTTLYYGKVEEDGIRCCYHGWKFDTEGRCLEQPCEPEGGLFKDKVRQPWYPLQERYGLIFAYLGPAEKQPALPRYDAWKTWTMASSSRPMILPSVAAAPPSSPATGCSISKTWSPPTTSRCCTALSRGRNSPT